MKGMVEKEFIKKAASYIFEQSECTIEEALSFVYNSETYSLVDRGSIDSEKYGVQELLRIFKEEVSGGRVQL